MIPTKVSLYIIVIQHGVRSKAEFESPLYQ